MARAGTESAFWPLMRCPDQQPAMRGFDLDMHRLYNFSKIGLAMNTRIPMMVDDLRSNLVDSSESSAQRPARACPASRSSETVHSQLTGI